MGTAVKYAFAGLFCLMVDSAAGQTQLNVATYGAVGDAVQFVCFTTSNSTLITTTNVTLTSAAIGDAIEIMQAGPRTVGIDSTGANATNSQDLIATIANVTSGTNITLSTVALRTLTNTLPPTDSTIKMLSRTASRRRARTLSLPFRQAPTFF
jgi:hypothetical protein